MKLIALLLALLAAPAARADHIAVSFGPSIHNFQNKLLSVGYEKTFGIPMSELLSCGVMFEGQTNYSCSAVTSIRIETAGGVFVRVGFGPALVAHVTDRLSARFPEYNIRYAFGFVQSGWGAGLEGYHMSDASPVFGAPGPNLGEDVVSLLWEFHVF